MSEFSQKQCGSCPARGTYEKAEEPQENLDQSFVPKPEIALQNRSALNEAHLGVPQNTNPPDLNVSPTPAVGSANKQSIACHSNQNKSKDGCDECCSKDNKIEEPCPDTPYALEQCKDKSKSQPLKGILKKSKSAQHIQPSSVNEPKPEKLVSGPCYLPFPQDSIPIQKGDAEMGPIGPWATGRIDWGPLAGITGTRPIVDRYSITRYSEGEWRTHNRDMLNMALEAQHKSDLCDWNGRKCLEQTRADVDKNQEDSTKRLTQRANDVHRWKCEAEAAIAAATEEIQFMEEQRRRLKQAMRVLMMPESIAGECLERRTGRADPELVRDVVEEELMKELALTTEIRDLFNRTLSDVEKQLLEDKTAKQRLEYDWSDKMVTHQIEAINVALNNASSTMLFKSGSTIFPNEQKCLNRATGSTTKVNMLNKKDNLA